MELTRYTQAGCLLAEDLGRNNSKYTYTGTTLVDSPFGKARSFNGTSDYINLGSVGGTFDTFTLSLKFRYTELANYRNLFDTDFPNNGIRFEVNATGSAAIRVLNISQPMGILELNKWYTLSISRTGASSINIYLNGNLIVNKNDIIYPSDLFKILNIGRGYNSFSERLFKGSIKELIIDNRVWTLQEITNYHNNTNFDYDKNIVSRWNLDATDTIKDLGWKGLGNDGVVNGNPVLEDSPFGKSLVLDGVGDYIMGPPSRNIVPNTSTEFTIVSFVNARNLTDITTSDNRLWTLSRVNAGSSSAIGVYIDKSDGVGRVHLFTYNGSVSNDIYSINTIELNKWNMISSTYQNGIFKIYLNTIYENTITDSLPNIGTIPFFIGTFGGADRYFNGIIDKMIIFNKALTNLEIKDLYNRTRRNEL